MDGLDIDMIKLYLLLYADDIVIFSASSESLQYGLDVLSYYCSKWRLKVNTDKTKVMIFRNGGTLPRNLSFTYEGKIIEIISKFVYLEITFTTEDLLQKLIKLCLVKH